MLKSPYVLLLSLLAAGTVLPQDQKPPAAGEKPQELEATLVAFKGTVDVKRPEDKDWVAAERNMKLKRGSEVCTAVASGATLLFTGNVKIEVKALTQAKVEDLAKAGAAIKADVNLKFGAIEVDIQKGDLKADMKVTAPNSTTSVSGSLGLVKAPAKGNPKWVTIKTKSGTWTHQPKNHPPKDLDGAQKGNNHGDSAKDLDADEESKQGLDFGGQPKGDLKGGPFGGGGKKPPPFLIPFFEYTRSERPSGGYYKKPAALPLPPGTP
jgi:hypothetical protein